MRVLGRLVAVAALTMLALATATAARAGAAVDTEVVGQVYVNDNTVGANTIAGFARHLDGSLTPLPGSPFAVGGLGTGHGLASQGALQLSSDGRYLLAVDAGSNQISVLRIKPDGSLRPVGGGPVASNGDNPVSIAVQGQLVYVANAGIAGTTGQTNYTGFVLNPGGHLSPLADSTVTLPDGSQPGDVLFSPDGSKLAGTRVGSSLIDSFTVGADGLLSAAPGSPFPAQGLGPFGSEFRPTNAAQLYVSNAHNGGTGTGTVSAFTDAPDGSLTTIGASPFPDGQTAPCWVEISHDGQVLFTVNTASMSISSYSIAPDGTLNLLESTPLAAPTATPEDARLSPDGSTLWVVDPGADTISGFTVSAGSSLTELPGSPVAGPAGATPSGIVVT